MGFVNKRTGTFNTHEYNWPEGVFPGFTTQPAFHVETSEDIKRKKYQGQSETAISHSPYWTPEQKAGNQSSLRLGNVPPPIKAPAFKPVNTVRYTNLKLCESNWLKYLNSVQLGIFDPNNPYVQDLANQSKIPDEQIRIMYEVLVTTYNKKPFDPENPLYVDGNGQATTRQITTIAESKSNPSLPTWEQYYKAISNLTSFYEGRLARDKSSGIVQSAPTVTKQDVSDVDNLLKQLESLKRYDSSVIERLTNSLQRAKVKMTQELGKRYNSSTSVLTGLEVNYSVASSDYLTIGDFQNAANREMDKINSLQIRKQQVIQAAAEKASKSSKTSAEASGNPLLDYSSDVVNISITNGKTAESSVDLRQRNIEKMHCNTRFEDTVATIKLIKQDSTIELIEHASASRTILKFGAQRPTVLQPGTQDLFETSNFVLQAMSEADSEKIQIIDNFGEPQIFMFGRRPRVYSYSGYLWNNKSNNWRSEFKELYERYLRGTKCVENGIKCLLTVGRSVRSGYMISCGMNHVADMDMATTFNFSLFIDAEKELLDTTIFDQTDTNQDAFALVRLQQANVQAERNTLKTAIEQKLKIPADTQAETPKPSTTTQATETATPTNVITPSVTKMPISNALSVDSLLREGQIKANTTSVDIVTKKKSDNKETLKKSISLNDPESWKQIP